MKKNFQAQEWVRVRIVGGLFSFLLPLKIHPHKLREIGEETSEKGIRWEKVLIEFRFYICVLRKGDWVDGVGEFL